MIGVTLEDVLKIPLVKNAKVLAGESSLNNFVRGIAVAEVPDIVTLAKKDTIYLSTLFAFKDESSLESLIKGLKDKGAAALFVKPKRFYGTVPQKAILTAKKLNFPLIEVEESVMWSDLMKLVLERILEEESKEKVERNFLQALLENSIQKENETIWRELLQLKKNMHFRVGVLELKKKESLIFLTPDDRERISRAIRSALSNHFLRIYVLPLTEKFVLFVVSDKPKAEDQRKLAEKLSTRIPESFLVLSRPFKELTEANERLKKIFMLSDIYHRAGPEESLILEELKVEDVIFAGLINSREVNELIEQLLGRFQHRFSKEFTSKILFTVFVFLKCDLNRKKTAEVLSLHVNTVKYRLKKFEELAGLNLSKSPDVFELYALLKVMQLKGLFKDFMGSLHFRHLL